MFENLQEAYPDPFGPETIHSKEKGVSLGKFYETQKRPEMQAGAEARFYQQTGKVGFCRRYWGISIGELSAELSRYFPVYENLVDQEERWSVRDQCYRLTKFISWLTEDILLYYDQCLPGYSSDDDSLEAVLCFAPDTDPHELGKACRIMEHLTGQAKENNSILYLSSTHFGVGFKRYPIRTVEMDLETHYNDDFMPVHTHMLEQLRTNGRSGLYLLHGVPGSGKTSYLRYLIGHLPKQKLYIPPGMAVHMENPQIMQEIREYPNAILIIEDAECILNRRDASRDATLASLLNITDGILGDCLNLQIICTFNTSLHNIDPALMRKGRMVARYEFTPLTEDKARRLAFAQGSDIYVNGPMTLAELYHAESFGHQEAVRKTAGFGR